MSQRVGRKPLSTGHVDHLCGSSRAKDRLRIFLETLQGTLTVPDACQLLELGEAQFHHLRRVWLQDALDALEPRRLGRPPKQESTADLSRRCAELEEEIQTLRAQILAHPTQQAGTKTADGASHHGKPC
jgi:hypothetical protein